MKEYEFIYHENKYILDIGALKKNFEFLLYEDFTTEEILEWLRILEYTDFLCNAPKIINKLSISMDKHNSFNIQKGIETKLNLIPIISRVHLEDGKKYPRDAPTTSLIIHQISELREKITNLIKQFNDKRILV